MQRAVTEYKISQGRLVAARLQIARLKTMVGHTLDPDLGREIDLLDAVCIELVSALERFRTLNPEIMNALD